MKLEEYLDEEFGLLRVKPHIYHLRPGYSGMYGIDGTILPAGVTIASVSRLNIDTMRAGIAMIENAYLDGLRQQSAASYLKHALEADGTAGVAVCDYRDQFSRKRGRIIAKGRLLKVLHIRAFGKDLGIEILVDESKTGIVIITPAGMIGFPIPGRGRSEAI